MGKNIAIIAAGGSGKRFGGSKKKQFAELNRRPLLFWTLDKFLQYDKISQILVTLPKEDIADFHLLLKKEYNTDKLKLIAGGNERQHSVYNALAACPSDTNFVFIHDGVRPFIRQEEISDLYAAAIKNNAVIPAFKVKNTIKQIAENKIEKTLPRQNLIAALTPQVFKFDLIWQCHQQARKQNLLFTDDAAILEHFGYPVFWLECSSQNIKITQPFDLKIAETILKNQIGE